LKNPLIKIKKAIDGFAGKVGKIPAKKLKIIAVSAIAVAIVAIGFMALYTSGVILKSDDNSGIEVQEITYEVQENEAEKSYLSKDLLQAITDSGERVKNAIDARPATVEVPEEELSSYVKIDNCLIADGGKVEVSASAEALPKSDDKYYYLFDIATYEDELPEGAEPIDKTYKDTAFTLDGLLNKGQADSRLYRKFLVAVKSGDTYKTVSHPSYVTNPEYIASYNYSGMSHNSKKGLLVDPSRLSELDDLGVNYATYNIPLNNFLTTSSAGSVGYTYNGVTYYFNAAILQQYDYLFTTLNAKGIDVAAILLNNVSPSNFPEITHPSARGGSTAPYYMYNATDESGVNALAAVATFLSSRYSGSGHGNVSMWIIGNEVNAKKEWNYMATSDISAYTAAYTRAFRVFYNAIKSVNAGANVYISLDQQWNRNRSNNPDFDARDMLDIFAASLREYGDIDWGVAHHPYSYPNENTPFWNSSSLVTNSADTSIITMNNIEVLTNYMQQESMLSPSGNVRSIILSEMGYSSTSGEALQAAAFAYAYTKIASNSCIDAMMLSRQTDAADEIAQFGLALGLCTTSGAHKYIYDVYKYIDTPRRNEVIAFAKPIVGKDF